jgi:hypothetical protein
VVKTLLETTGLFKKLLIPIDLPQSFSGRCLPHVTPRGGDSQPTALDANALMFFLEQRDRFTRITFSQHPNDPASKCPPFSSFPNTAFTFTEEGTDWAQSKAAPWHPLNRFPLEHNLSVLKNFIWIEQIWRLALDSCKFFAGIGINQFLPMPFKS